MCTINYLHTSKHIDNANLLSVREKGQRRYTQASYLKNLFLLLVYTLYTYIDRTVFCKVVLNRLLKTYRVVNKAWKKNRNFLNNQSTTKKCLFAEMILCNMARIPAPDEPPSTESMPRRLGRSQVGRAVFREEGRGRVSELKDRGYLSIHMKSVHLCNLKRGNLYLPPPERIFQPNPFWLAQISPAEWTQG